MCTTSREPARSCRSSTFCVHRNSRPPEAASRSAARARAWWAAFVVVPLVLGAAAAFLGKSSIESNLQQRVERSVAGTGVAQVSVSVDGRDVTAVVPARSGNDAIDSVRDAASHVDGVRTVKVHR